MKKGGTELTDFKGMKIVYVMTGSFCTFNKSFEQMKKLVELGADVQPLMSYNASSTDTRFGTAQENIKKAETICGKRVISDIAGAEPIGPKKLADIVVVAPCTGNTLAKLAANIIDTPAVMAVKSHLRNSGSVVLCIATNDALSGSAQNIGTLMNRRNYYFVPFSQDDFKNKPSSAVADFTKIPETILMASQGIQIQPVI